MSPNDLSHIGIPSIIIKSAIQPSSLPQCTYVLLLVYFIQTYIRWLINFPDGLSGLKPLLFRSDWGRAARHRHYFELRAQRQGHGHERHDLRCSHSPQVYSLSHSEDLHEKLGIIGGMLVASGVFFHSFGYGSSNNFTPFGPANQITAQTS